MNTISPGRVDRRQNPQLREIFVRSCDLLAPIVAANENVKSVSNFAMAHMLGANFPELSSAEVQIVIMTVERLHRERRLHTILKKG